MDALQPSTSQDPSLAAPPTGRKIAMGAAFMVLGRLITRCVSVVSTLILVRLLVPEDFGLIAMAGVAVTLAETLTATGFAVALVRRQTVDRTLYDTAWTMNLLRCLVLGGLIAATASWQAQWLGDARLGPVLQVIALTIALDGLLSVGLIRLQRDMRFDLLFRQQVTFRLVAFLATIVLAWATQSYWCLVLGNLIAKFVAIPYSYWLAPHRPRASLRDWRELLHFSKWIFAHNLCTAADGQAATLVVGRIAGLPALGVFNVSYQLGATPVTELAVPVRGPIYAGYARAMHDLVLLRRQFSEGFGLLLAVLLPFSVGIALVAPEIEYLALGPRWAGAATIIALCTLFAMADAVGHFTFNLFAVLDRLPRLVAIYATMVTIRLPVVILATLEAGLVGMATAMLATAILNAVIWQWQALRLIGLPAAQFCAQFWRSLAAAAVMACAVLVLRALLSQAGGVELAAPLLLCLLVACGAAVHIGTQWLLWRWAGHPPGAEAQLQVFGAQIIRRLRPGHSAAANIGARK